MSRQTESDPAITLGCLAVVGVLFVICMGVKLSYGTDEAGNNTLFRGYVADMYPEAAGFKVITAKCMDVDSDFDAYVTCTVVLTGPDGSTTTEAFDCSQLYGDCRTMKRGAR